jgi:TonB-linked SusC/RagA family outer membrane protein
MLFSNVNEERNEEGLIVQQSTKISGRVVDKDGFSITGVTVRIKGKTIGVTTDVDGKYTIECTSEETLVFSFIGFRTMERTAGDINKVTITMEEEFIEMEEVVVVAFGKQKKESVVSSISTISPKDLKVPSSNLTTAFAGRIAGVIAYQRQGEPGLDNAEFFIRGITSFSAGGKKDPLILIDGIEMGATDLSRVNPDDIASFSVMKDANAAALYGARGANGVILVTTKEGVADKLSINIRMEASSSANSELVQLADPITYMQLHNEAVRTRDPLVAVPYSTAKIRNTQLGLDPVNYPSVDWYHYLIKDKAYNQRINANITGGGKAVQYYIAANLQHDTGILKADEENKFDNNIDVVKFQLRSNVTIKLTPQTKAMVRFYGTFDDLYGPRQGGSDAFVMTRNASPVRFLPSYPKDEANIYTNHILYGMAEKEGAYDNPLALLASGYKESKTSMMLAQLELEHTFDKALKGLFVKGIYNIKRDSYYDYQRSYNPFYYAPATTTDGSYALTCFNPDTGTEYLTYNFGSKTVASYVYAEGRAGYNKMFADKHDLNVLLVASLRDATNTEATSIQESLPQRNLSTAGRLAYGFDSRYFIEGNFGYNGSERFAMNNRWGFFPSAGAGWMVSNETFMQSIDNILTKVKLKATYGLVGNDQIGYLSDRFFYLSQVNMSDGNRGYTFGTDKGYYKSGISVSRYANELITWEVAKKLNLGIELTLLNDFEILADYFTETRENILQTRSDVPATMGLVTIPQANVGVAQGHGAEAEVRYQKNFNRNVYLVVNGNFTYATSKYKEYEEPDYSDTPWKTHVGKKLSQPYGLIAERLFIDDYEVQNSPKQMFGEYGAGDIKYLDINDDGQINEDDIVPIGYPTTPEIIYGGGFTVGAYGFDLSCFFQGSARSSFFITPTWVTPFINNGQRALLQYIADDHWSESNRDIYAFWPRLSDHAIDNNNQLSTHWLRDGTFLRLKTAEFGYTVPARITQKMQISMMRVYLSGTNLLLWSKFKMWDPEMAGYGLGYPLQRVFNVGLNINF